MNGIGVAFVTFLFLLIPPSLSHPATSDAGSPVRDLLAQCQAAYYRLVDYQGSLHLEIGEKGVSTQQDVMSVAFRKPGFLSIHWQEGVHKDARLLVRPAWNRGNVFVRLGGWFDYVSLSVPATEIGEPFAPNLKDVSEWLSALVGLAQRPASDRSLQLVKLRSGDPTLAEGRVVLAIPAFLIPFRDNTVATYEFLIERGTGIPHELVLRDAGGEVRQRLTYTDLQINVGVPSQVFNWEDMTDETQGIPQKDATIDLRRFSQHWLRRYGEINDYTGQWITRGQGGVEDNEKQMLFKFRKPFDLYLHWTPQRRTVQEALFRQGWNRGRVRLRMDFGGLPLIGDLPLDGPFASHYLPPFLSDFGINRLVERLQEWMLRAWLREELEVRFLGVQNHDERPCYVLEVAFSSNQGKADSPARVLTFWDIGHQVPVKQTVFNQRGEIKEYQEFRQLQMNTALGESDFDAANPAYGFLLLRGAPGLDWFLTGRE